MLAVVLLESCKAHLAGGYYTSVVKKFVEKTVKNVCIDSSVLNTSDSKSVQDLKKSFKVLDILSKSAKTMSVKAADHSAESIKVPEEEQEEIVIPLYRRL